MSSGKDKRTILRLMPKLCNTIHLSTLLSACRELEAKVQSTENEDKNLKINLSTLTKGILPGEFSLMKCQAFHS